MRRQIQIVIIALVAGIAGGVVGTAFIGRAGAIPDEFRAKTVLAETVVARNVQLVDEKGKVKIVMVAGDNSSVMWMKNNDGTDMLSILVDDQGTTLIIDDPKGQQIVIRGPDISFFNNGKIKLLMGFAESQYPSISIKKADGELWIAP